MTRVLVCGGRDYNSVHNVYEVLDRVLLKYGDNMIVIHGSCPTGADYLAEKWAKDREVGYMGFPARWNIWNGGLDARCRRSSVGD